MVEMEREHGSLVRAMFARRKQGKGPSRLLSFDRGLHTLIQGLAGRLGRTVRADARVTSLERTPSHWLVRTDRGEAHAADHVVLAVSARAAAAIVAGLDPALAASLAAIPFSGIHVVALGYRIADVPHPLDGYGYLVTRPERMATLGVVWESSLFPGRAPEGMALLRVFLGGARRPELAGAAAPTAIAAACADLEHVLGITAAPVRTWTFPWPNAIAQYTVGHLGRVSAIRGRLQQHPGLSVCGTSYDGTSFNHAIAAGSRAGRNLAAALASGAAADQRHPSSLDRRGPHTPPGEPALAYS
jgi:oxygen-dependent protoporphyrinogen oxidase